MNKIDLGAVFPSNEEEIAHLRRSSLPFDGICQDFELLADDLRNTMLRKHRDIGANVPQIICSMEGLAEEIGNFLKVPAAPTLHLIKQKMKNL